MGRGKSKAKQTKVARELKYGSCGNDLSALEAELKLTSADKIHDTNVENNAHTENNED